MCETLYLSVRSILQSSDGSTAMHLAASIGAVSIIELLLLNGGKADVQDFEGRSPLHWATLQKGTKTFAVLLKVWREGKREGVRGSEGEGGGEGDRGKRKDSLSGM